MFVIIQQSSCPVIITYTVADDTKCLRRLLDAESERQKAEWREQAKHELEDWYKHRLEQLDKQKKVNRYVSECLV